MATALKHKQRSCRSYHKNKQLLGNAARLFEYKAGATDMAKQIRFGWIERMKSLLKKGE